MSERRDVRHCLKRKEAESKEAKCLESKEAEK
jgi:hypothetical protein